MGFTHIWFLTYSKVCQRKTLEPDVTLLLSGVGTKLYIHVEFFWKHISGRLKQKSKNCVSCAVLVTYPGDLQLLHTNLFVYHCTARWSNIEIFHVKLANCGRSSKPKHFDTLVLILWRCKATKLAGSGIQVVRTCVGMYKTNLHGIALCCVKWQLELLQAENISVQSCIALCKFALCITNLISCLVTITVKQLLSVTKKSVGQRDRGFQIFFVFKTQLMSLQIGPGRPADYNPQELGRIAQCAKIKPERSEGVLPSKLYPQADQSPAALVFLLFSQSY